MKEDKVCFCLHCYAFKFSNFIISSFFIHVTEHWNNSVKLRIRGFAYFFFMIWVSLEHKFKYPVCRVRIIKNYFQFPRCQTQWRSHLRTCKINFRAAFSVTERMNKDEAKPSMTGQCEVNSSSNEKVYMSAFSKQSRNSTNNTI